MEIKQMQEVFSNEEYAKELFSCRTPEEAKDYLASKGVDMSIDELKELHDLLIRYHEDKLTEQEKKHYN